MAYYHFFFFQAEDGIRDKLVLEFRRVLFRSPIVAAAGGGQVQQAPQRPEGIAVARVLAVVGRERTHLAAVEVTDAAAALHEHRSEERRVGKECRSRWAAGR